MLKVLFIFSKHDLSKLIELIFLKKDYCIINDIILKDIQIDCNYCKY
jgi:hypothetical protein